MRLLDFCGDVAFVAFVYPDGRGDRLDLLSSSLDSSLPFGALAIRLRMI